MLAVAANTLGTLLAAVIVFAWARAAGFLQGVQIDWGGALIPTVLTVVVFVYAFFVAIRDSEKAPRREDDNNGSQ